MKNGYRDLLVVSKLATLNEAEMQKELNFLDRLLCDVESMANYAIVNEIVDINTYKIIRKPLLVARAIRDKSHKPFIFICNKN